jgi:predicted transcriptional regulator
MNQGNKLRLFLRGLDITMEEIANRLGMTRQNLSYHLRKEKLDADFFASVKSVLHIDLKDEDFIIVSGAQNENSNYVSLLESQLKFTQDIYQKVLLETLQKVKRLEVNLAMVSEGMIRNEATLQVNMNRVAYMEIILKNNVLDKDPARAQALKNQYDVLKKEIEQQIVDNALRIKDLTDRKAEAMTAL